MIDLDSKVIIESHLQCAGLEMPLSLEDEKYFGPFFKEICETRLKRDKDGWLVRLLVLETKISQSSSGIILIRSSFPTLLSIYH